MANPLDIYVDYELAKQRFIRIKDFYYEALAEAGNPADLADFGELRHYGEIGSRALASVRNFQRYAREADGEVKALFIYACRELARIARNIFQSLEQRGPPPGMTADLWKRHIVGFKNRQM